MAPTNHRGFFMRITPYYDEDESDPLDMRPLAVDPGPAPSAPVFTKQPGADSNITGHAGTEPDTTYTPFSAGKAAIISAGTVTVDSDATVSWQWQGQNTDGSWSNISTQKQAQFSLASPVSGDDRLYRVVATATRNGQTASTTSDSVAFRERFLFLQNDTNNTGSLAVSKTSNDAYTMTAPAGTSIQSIGAFVRLVSNPGNNNGGMGAPRIDSAVSDNAAVVVDSTSGRQSKLRFISAGTAKVTIRVSNLVSVLTVTVS